MADSMRERLQLQKERNKALMAEGFAAPELISNAKPGAVFTVVDAAITFPTDRLPTAGQRSEHEGRRVIVVQSRALCGVRFLKTMQVVPCEAHSGKPADPCDLEIPQDEDAFTALHVVALASIAQPVLKADLLRFHGNLKPQTLARLQGVLARNMDWTPGTSGLPPRP